MHILFLWENPPGTPRRQCDNSITNDRTKSGLRESKVDENGSGLYPVESFGFRGAGFRTFGLLPECLLNSYVHHYSACSDSQHFES